MNIAKSALKLSTVRFLKAVLSFLGIVFFAQELGATNLGSFFLFQALLIFGSIPADFGLRGSLEKRISEGQNQESFLSSAIVLKIPPIVLIALAILLLENTVNGYIGADLALYLVIAIVLREYSLLAKSALRGELRVEETAILTLTQTVVWIGLGSILISFGYGVYALVYSLIMGLTVTLIWGWYRCSTSVGKPTISHIRSLADYGQYNFISSIGGYAYNWIDVAIIGVFLTQAHVSAYEIAWRITSIVMVFSSAIATTIFPQVSQWDAAGAREKIESLIPKAVTPPLMLVIPAFCGTVVFSREILGLMFGSEYMTAWFVLIILMGEKILQSVHIILGRALQGINRPDLAAKAGVIAMVINIVLNVVLVVQYGIIGAATATALSFGVNSLLHAYYLSKFMIINIPYSRIASAIVASFGMSIILVVVRSALPIDTLLKLSAIISLGVILYIGFVLLIPYSREIIIENSRRMIEEYS